MTMPNQPPAEPMTLFEPMTLVELDENETEEELEAFWQALCYRSLWEVWDNEADAVYDMPLEAVE